MRRAGAAALLLLLTGCGAAPPGEAAGVAPPPAATAPEPTFALTDRDIAEVVRTVGAARQLAPARPVAIERLPLQRFAERLLGKGPAKPAGEALTPEAAFLLGFDFVPAPGARAGVATLDDVLREQVVGFYDRAADRVFLPDVRLRSEGDLLEQEAVLAHEVHHAVQAQRFPPLPKPRSSDEAIAELALVEGDAMVAMGAWLGAEAGAPVGRTLRRIVEVTKRVPLEKVARGDATSKLDRALAVTKERLEFPYRDGMMLVSDVYRTGGFPLVDRMYGAVPRTTEQVLHPEKYLAGELPRPIADPRPPRGYAVAEVDTLGELDARTLFARCLDAPAAERAAAGWDGDRYGVFVGPDHRLAVAWVSAWDTEQDAAEAEAALGKRCFHDNALGLARGDYTIGSDVDVRREGTLVAFLRGYPVPAGAAAEALFSLVGRAPPPSPLTDARIPPRVRLPEPVPGRLVGDVYQNAWLGLVGRVPPGMRARSGGDLDLVVERPDVLVHGAMGISTRITSDEQNEKTFREVEASFAREVAEHAMQVQRLGGGPVRTALGAAVERTWRVAGTWVELRLVLVPICAGTGSIVFVEAYGDPYARSVLDGWMASFRWTRGRNLTACDFLDPK